MTNCIFNLLTLINTCRKVPLDDDIFALVSSLLISLCINVFCSFLVKDESLCSNAMIYGQKILLFMAKIVPLALFKECTLYVQHKLVRRKTALTPSERSWKRPTEPQQEERYFQLWRDCSHDPEKKNEIFILSQFFK